MTDFLYSNPSFFDGAAKALDIGGVYDVYNTSTTPSEADLTALKSDWMAVGKDMRSAMDSVEKK